PQREPDPQPVAPAPPRRDAIEETAPRPVHTAPTQFEAPRKHDDPQEPRHEDVAAPVFRAAEHPQAATPAQPDPAAPHRDRHVDAAPEAQDASRTEPEVRPEPPKTFAPVREIRFEVAGAERRVEVKVSDRGGEVQIAVRTPDDHLAG